MGVRDSAPLVVPALSSSDEDLRTYVILEPDVIPH